MRPRGLLFTGIGTLIVGLLLLLTIDADPATASARAALVLGYLSNACVLIGTGLVILAAVVSALNARDPAAPPPAIDYYS